MEGLACCDTPQVAPFDGTLAHSKMGSATASAFRRSEGNDMGTISVTGRSLKGAIAAALALALALMMAAWPAYAFAAESSSSASASASSSSASQAYESRDAIPLLDEGMPLMGNDYVWAGANLVLGDHSFDNDLIAAGQSVSLANCTVGGSIRAAAREVAVSDSMAYQNITLAGQDVAVKGSMANAVALVGQSVSFSGSCNELSAYAEKVFIDGTVDGDVVVGANEVEIGTNARIKGTLHVSAPSEPVMQRGAEVGNVEYTKAERASSGDVESAFSGMAAMFSVMAIVIGIVGTVACALLAEWLFRRQTAGAAEMIRNRTGAFIGTGVIAALVAPLVVILLMALGVTLPAAFGIMFALFAMTAVAGGFMGASVFKLAFPKLGRFVRALIGGAIVGVASALPFVGAVVSAAAFMYLLGYVLQSIFLGMRDPAPKAPAPAAAAAPQGYQYNGPMPGAQAPMPGYPQAAPTQATSVAAQPASVQAAPMATPAATPAVATTAEIPPMQGAPSATPGEQAIPPTQE